MARKPAKGEVIIPSPTVPLFFAPVGNGIPPSWGLQITCGALLMDWLSMAAHTRRYMTSEVADWNSDNMSLFSLGSSFLHFILLLWGDWPGRVPLRG